ncbi:hypothetical protein Zmor_018907 [Zophobas morio]|uniref:Reverse transcriptase RNase H-like domain-containing protein n=1 Tax=Zophobas morio TaxID=2755281 RepID=A0AA38ME76_9CUCU|nr:hypothetical protein Zmor_018907 [Zophobas morio]
MTISAEARMELQWWSQTLPNTSAPIHRPNFSVVIFTDASRSGWGAVSGDDRVHGHWSEDEKRHHINYLELLAIFLALKHFGQHLSDCAILLRVDNTPAIAYINKMGDHLAKEILQWAEQKHLWLFASYSFYQSCKKLSPTARKV